MDNLQQESEVTIGMATVSDYDRIAGLFIYPVDESYKDTVKSIYQYLQAEYPEAAADMEPFISYVGHSTFREMQELYLRSFDVQAITSLDIGYILFGEDYKRGQLLVHLNQEHKQAGNNCHTELADHLPNVLRLIARIREDSLRDEIATRLVMPALRKMMREFTPEKLQKKDEIYKKHQKTVLEYSQPYRVIYLTLLQALFSVMKRDFKYDPEEADEAHVKGCEESAVCSKAEGADFEKNIEMEMTIEKEK